MTIESRSFSSQTYRFGFNGQEKDNDFANENLNFGARIYDSRIGRWHSVDAYSGMYSSYSSYNYALNNPIVNIDTDGNFVITTTVVATVVASTLAGVIAGAVTSAYFANEGEGKEAAIRGAISGGVGGLVLGLGMVTGGGAWMAAIGSEAAAGSTILATLGRLWVTGAAAGALGETSAQVSYDKTMNVSHIAWAGFWGGIGNAIFVNVGALFIAPHIANPILSKTSIGQRSVFNEVPKGAGKIAMKEALAKEGIQKGHLAQMRPKQLTQLADARKLRGEEKNLWDWGLSKLPIYITRHVGMANTKYVARAAMPILEELERENPLLNPPLPELLPFPAPRASDVGQVIHTRRVEGPWRVTGYRYNNAERTRITETFYKRYIFLEYYENGKYKNSTIIDTETRTRSNLYKP